jgi:hypothetical protein
MAIIGIALGVGAILFAFSFWGGGDAFGLRLGRGATAPPAPEQSPADESSDLGDSFTFVPVTPDSLTWRRRVTGLLGLVLVVGVAAAVLAFGVYQAAHLINETIGKFLEQ